MTEKFVVFYSVDSDYCHFFVDASSLGDAEKFADAFALKTGSIIVGIVPLRLFKMYHYE